MCFDSRNLSSGIERSYTPVATAPLGPCGIERVVKRTTHGSKAMADRNGMIEGKQSGII